MKKYQTLLIMLCMLPILSSCDTFKVYVSPEHPFIMLGVAIAILAFWFLVFQLAMHYATKIVAEILFFFFPFRLHYNED